MRLEAEKNVPPNEHSPQSAMSRRQFWIAAGAALTTWSISNMMTDHRDVPVEDPPRNFELIPDNTNLRGSRFALHGDGESYIVELIPSGESGQEQCLKLNGRTFQPDRQFNGINVTHSSLAQKILKHGNGVCVDCGILGRAFMSKEEIFSCARTLASAKDTDAQVRILLTYRYIVPMLGIPLAEETQSISMKRVDEAKKEATASLTRKANTVD